MPETRIELTLHELALVTLALTRLALVGGELGPQSSAAHEARELVHKIVDALPDLTPELVATLTPAAYYPLLAIRFDAETLT